MTSKARAIYSNSRGNSSLFQQQKRTKESNPDFNVQTFRSTAYQEIVDFIMKKEYSKCKRSQLDTDNCLKCIFQTEDGIPDVIKAQRYMIELWEEHEKLNLQDQLNRMLQFFQQCATKRADSDKLSYSYMLNVGSDSFQVCQRCYLFAHRFTKHYWENHVCAAFKGESIPLLVNPIFKVY